MAARAVVNISLPQPLVERADALISRVQQRSDAEGVCATIKRATVLRLAVRAGLPAIEKDYGLGEPSGGKGKSEPPLRP